MKKSRIIIFSFILVISVVSLYSCFMHNLEKKSSYESKLKSLKEAEFNRNYKTTLASCQSKFKTKNSNTEFFLADSLLPFWFNTRWDFNGVTQTPRKGKIACGYFVTNTLSSIGHPLKRIWYAQQAASVLIKRVCEKSTIKTFTGHNIKGLKKYMEKGKDGLYLIGLDSHVGYIYKRNGKSYFIHSNNWPHRRVIKEPLLTSMNIKESGFYMIGKLNLFL